jgi:beta-lactamase class A
MLNMFSNKSIPFRIVHACAVLGATFSVHGQVLSAADHAPGRVNALSLVSAVQPSASESALQKQIGEIAADAHGKVSVACSLPGTSLSCDLNPKARPPMQSVFKMPLAIAILHMVEQDKLSLDQPIRFRPEDRFVPHAYSPLQDKYPDANVDVPLRDLLQGAVSLSDNAAADILLRLAGGPKPVNDYIASLGVAGFQLLDGEHALHRDVSAQYRNWFEPAGAVQLLRRISDHSPLTVEHTDLLLSWMRAATTVKRLNGDMPPGTLVAHKSGTSDVDNGLAHATNDIGLITLPDGRRLAIAVFVTDSTADEATREKAIARIGRAAYDAAVQTHR